MGRTQVLNATEAELAAEFLKRHNAARTVAPSTAERIFRWLTILMFFVALALFLGAPVSVWFSGIDLLGPIMRLFAGMAFVAGIFGLVVCLVISVHRKCCTAPISWEK